MLLFRCHRRGTTRWLFPCTPEALVPPSVALLFVISSTAFRPAKLPPYAEGVHVSPSSRERSHIRNDSYKVDRPHRTTWRATVPSHARNGFNAVLQSMRCALLTRSTTRVCTFRPKYPGLVRLLKLTNYSILFVFTVCHVQDSYVGHGISNWVKRDTFSKSVFG